MLHSPIGPPRFRTFVVNVDHFKTWAWEYEIFRHLRFEEIFTILLSPDWLSFIWSAAFRSKRDELNLNETIAYLDQYIATHLASLTQFRTLLYKIIENLIACPLEGQEVVFVDWLGPESIAFRLRPWPFLPLTDFSKPKKVYAWRQF